MGTEKRQRIMKDIYDELRKIIDTILNEETLGQKGGRKKRDGSLVTHYDERIEDEIVNYFCHLSDDLHVIGEESFEGSIIPESFQLQNRDFLIVDPIDGTENFLYLQSLYGCAISWRIKECTGHMIYIPAQNLCIHTGNIAKNSYRGSNIALYSSACLKELDFHRPQDARVVGSSSWMMAQFLSGNVLSYTYCAGAKIWDCYTGLSLAASNPQCRISLENNQQFKEWRESPTFKTKFRIRWN